MLAFRDVEFDPLREGRQPRLVDMERLIMQPECAPIACQHSIFRFEGALFHAARLIFGQHALPVCRMDLPFPEIRVGAPFFGREAQQLFHLRADVDGLIGWFRGDDVGDGRDALDQQAITGLCLFQCRLCLFALG